jgi:hypothetical protein
MGYTPLHEELDGMGGRGVLTSEAVGIDGGNGELIQETIHGWAA